MAKKPILMLVDGSAIFYRAYHAIPHLTNSKGQPTNAVYGFTTMLLKAIQDLKPDYIAVAWDKSSDTFRKEMYPEYKANRIKQPDDLYAQMPVARQVVEAMAIPFIELDNYEADDIIGTLAANAKDQETIIVTGDLDELQLVDESTKVYAMRRGMTDTKIYDLAAVAERYGMTPEQFIDFKALKGDPSDNIPGVPGVGEKTAMSLIQQYGSLDEVYEHLDEQKGKLRERLEDNKDQAYLSQQLSRIVCDAPVELDLAAAKTHDFSRQEVFNLFRELEFKSLLDKLPRKASADQPGLFAEEEAGPAREHLDAAKYTCIDDEQKLADLVASLEKQAAFAFDVETDSVDSLTAKLCGMSVSFKEGEAYYIPCGHREGKQLDAKRAAEMMKSVLENPAIAKVGHNLKFDYEVMNSYGVKLNPVSFDTMIASFLLNPLARTQTLSDLAFRELGIEMIPIEDLIGKRGRGQTTFDAVAIEEAVRYAAEDADVSWRLYERLKPQVEERYRRLTEEIEWPLISVLAEMEIAGIALDEEFLKKFNKTISSRILELEEKIYAQCGQRFNLSAPAQLSKILYDKLGLTVPGIRRGKTGSLSTAARELEKLQGQHPVIDLIMEHRELMKLKTTYVDALPRQVSPKDGRVHTSFSQTIAQTGRLSSNNPNLQNIPIRTEIGREIRKAFIAPKGKVLVGADYSQIELRVAAALSKDPDMIETFKQGIDLHQRTAAEMFSVPLEQVTKEQRYAAKTINFGVLYGMSAHGLSQATGMEHKEAQAFIDRYFEVRGSLRDYIEQVKREAKEKEYVETLFGRRRPCPEINSNNYMVRNAAERMAVNVPIQGTAADIVKLAMIQLASRLDKGTLLLQVHDELIAECAENDAEEVAKIMNETMENVYDLGVPLVAETSIGKNWGELK